MQLPRTKTKIVVFRELFVTSDCRWQLWCVFLFISFLYSSYSGPDAAAYFMSTRKLHGFIYPVYSHAANYYRKTRRGNFRVLHCANRSLGPILAPAETGNLLLPGTIMSPRQLGGAYPLAESRFLPCWRCTAQELAGQQGNEPWHLRSIAGLVIVSSDDQQVMHKSSQESAVLCPTYAQCRHGREVGQEKRPTVDGKARENGSERLRSPIMVRGPCKCGTPPLLRRRLFGDSRPFLFITSRHSLPRPSK
jgi:hypothetical protein